MAAISASPVISPFRRRNSSAEMTTTSSRPCTVTCELATSEGMQREQRLRPPRRDGIGPTLLICGTRSVDGV